MINIAKKVKLYFGRISVSLTFCLFSFGPLFSQEGKFVIIGDTLQKYLNKENLSVYVEIGNRLVTFVDKNHLVYPDSTLVDSISAVKVCLKDDTISFFDLNIKVKQSRMPLFLIKALQPNFKELKNSKTNMYLYIDCFPFDNTDNEQLALGESKRLSLDISSVFIFTLYYQVSESMPIVGNVSH